MPLKTLIEFGLSEKEAAVYLTLLELEVAGVNEIAQKTGINRSSTYVVIESLKKKGLLSMSPDKKIQQYVAASPDALLELANTASEHSTAVQKKIETIVPELRSLHKETRNRPKVFVYEGDEANRLSYYSTFDSKEFRIFKDLQDMPDAVPTDYIEKDAAKRRKDGVKLFMISPSTPTNKEIMRRYKAAKAPDLFALVPKSKFSKSGTNIGIGIYKDRIKFASGKDKFAIFIVNQAITDTLRDLFDLAWAESKRFDKLNKKAGRQ